MDIFLWVLQVILAIKGVSTAVIHGLGWNKESIQKAVQRFGDSARAFLIGSAVVLLLGSLGVVVPQALGFLPWLTPLSALLLAISFLVSIGLHLKAREKPMIFVSLILFAFATIVVIGRWT